MSDGKHVSTTTLRNWLEQLQSKQLSKNDMVFRHAFVKSRSVYLKEGDSAVISSHGDSLVFEISIYASEEEPEFMFDGHDYDQCSKKLRKGEAKTATNTGKTVSMVEKMEEFTVIPTGGKDDESQQSENYVA